MVATKTKIYCLAEEGHKPVGRKQNGMMKLPKGADLGTLKSIARRVLEVLKSKVTMNSPDGISLPLLMTRVDMGVMQNGEFKPWVNEVEYVPSYYVEDHTHPIEGTVGKQCALIASKYTGVELSLSNPARLRLKKSIEFKRTVEKRKPSSKLTVKETKRILIDTNKESSATLAKHSSVQDMAAIVESSMQQVTSPFGEWPSSPEDNHRYSKWC